MMNSGRRPSFVPVLLVATALVVPLSTAPRAVAQTGDSRAFATPEDAVNALVAAARSGKLDELLLIFGPSGKELIASSDPATARHNQRVFTVAAKEKWQLVDAGSGRKTLVIGNEEWPFPVPLVSGKNGWVFDAAAGREEIIARRIGRNELSAIATTRAYVTAQKRYAEQGHDGQAAGAFATKFQSDTGTQNGLYWPTGRGEKRSPLGDLVAEAAAEGRTLGGKKPAPLNGYYFRILTAQGSAVAGGARSYIVNGRMTRGFALVAWPAEYDVTGVMTFVVDQSGIVREKDLGPGTDAVVGKMTAYNPDSSWQVVK